MEVGFGEALLIVGTLLAVAAALSGLMRGTVLSTSVLSVAVGIALAFSVAGALSLFVFATVRGMAHGGTIVDDPVLSKHCFGPKVLGRTIGVLTAIATAGFAVGPPVMGYLYDTQGSYRTAFLLLVAMSIAASLSLFGARARYLGTVPLVAFGAKTTRGTVP